MRQIRLEDLHHAARAVLNVPQQEQAAFCRSLLWRAHVADKYVKRLGKLHPEWGDGSLRNAVLRVGKAAVRPRCTDDLCAALQLVLGEVQRQRGRQIF